MVADLRREEKAIARLQENKEISPLKPQNASAVWFLSVAVDEYSHVNMPTSFTTLQRRWWRVLMRHGPS